MNIFIFSPALSNHAGMPSLNLGDVIIRRAIDGVITRLFPKAVLEYASSHVPLPMDILERALKADLVLIAGSNLLSSDIMVYNQWKLYEDQQKYLKPDKLRAVLFGVGWWQYQSAPTPITSKFYSSVLHPNILHSLRDSYTQQQFIQTRIKNSINTSCPTLWGLGGKDTTRTIQHERCLFCLTDYKKNLQDEALLSMLCDSYDELLFYPQGSGDITYIQQLSSFLRNKDKIAILPHEINIFTKLTQIGGMDYIGTRLHAGAWCLQHNMQTLILSVDNRATEIARDTNLPVIDRSDIDSLKLWLKGERLFKPMILPEKAIQRWEKNLVAGNC